MAQCFLHLTHTDIRSDNRILKEMLSLRKSFSTQKVIGIGAELSEKSAPAHIEKGKIHIVTLTLLGNRLPSSTHRTVRHVINFLDLTLRCVFLGLKCKPAIVHCHDTFVLPAGVLIKLALGAKLVYDAHELESDKNGQSILLANVTLTIERACWRFVDLLISVSGSILEWYNANLGTVSSLLILNAPLIRGASSINHSPSSSEGYFNLRYGIPLGRPIFIYLGIFGRGRGIEVVLSDFTARASTADIVFVGYGDLEQLIQDFADSHVNIHLHPAVPHDEVVKLISSADYGLCLIENVSLSDYYSLPNKLFEYAFGGLKVVASDFPEISSIVNSFDLGICLTTDPVDIKSSIDRLLDGHCVPKPSLNLSELSWEAQEIRLVRAYADLCK
jgi:glycosyltransferase involved in cell wall biosynthesis